MAATRTLAHQADAAEQARQLLSAAVNDADGEELDNRISLIDGTSK